MLFIRCIVDIPPSVYKPTSLQAYKPTSIQTYKLQDCQGLLPRTTAKTRQAMSADAASAADSNPAPAPASSSTSSSASSSSYVISAARGAFAAHRAKVAGVVAFVATYMAWACLSYFSAHLYAHFCADWTVSGFLAHPFMTVTPQCSALRWLMVQGAAGISQSFVLVSTIVIAVLVAPAAR